MRHRLERLGHLLARAAHHQRDALGALEAAIEVLRRVLGHHAAVGDDDDARAGRGHLGQDVRAQDDGVLAAERLDQVARLDDLLRVEAAGRLVEDEHGRIAEQRLGQADALPAAPWTACRSDRSARCAMRAFSIARSTSRRRSLDALDLAHEVQIRAHAHVGIERHGFGQIADVGAGLERLAWRRRSPRPRRRPPEGGQIPGQHAHGGRLARAVGAEKAEDFALADVEGHVGDRHTRAVVLGQVLDANHATSPPQSGLG